MTSTARSVKTMRPRRLKGPGVFDPLGVRVSGNLTAALARFRIRPWTRRISGSGPRSAGPARNPLEEASYCQAS